MKNYLVYIQHRVNKVLSIGVGCLGGNLTDGCSGDNLAATNSLKFIPEIDDELRIDMTEFVNYEIEYESGEGSSEVAKNDDDAIIGNALHKDVAKDEIYINNKIIVSAMKNFALHEKFQFKAKKSSAARYYV
ncbi:hypothetical protein HAX54_022422 [Datura stramonium]|uniref:Uncharacterized protein n=1 Tax=Datura stramonium TaxID=4076 RepID=A0ABS8S4C7_DATST|nr:hypothetical protein [Datura stramonium]